MEQRRLRLGDILDDYCPRERRVTNHAVVAMIEEDVKQTRCTTCDAEHPYKGGHAPRRKKKDAAAARAPVAPPSIDSPVETLDDEFHEEEILPTAPMAVADEAEQDVDETLESSDERDIEDGPVHRPLIRATLPRPEGQKDARTPPDFTIRQAGGRGNNPNVPFRGGAGGAGNSRMRPRTGGQGGNGHRPHGSHGGRFAGARGPGGQGPGQGRGGQGGGGFRPAQQQPRHGGGGRKRSR